jgi:hypothetical protein
MPTNVQPHLGASILNTLHTQPSKIRPTSEIAFAIAIFVLSSVAREIIITGIQNDRPPTTIQYNLFRIASLQSNHWFGFKRHERWAPVPGIRLLRSITPGVVAGVMP